MPGVSSVGAAVQAVAANSEEFLEAGERIHWRVGLFSFSSSNNHDLT